MRWVVEWLQEIPGLRKASAIISKEYMSCLYLERKCKGTWSGISCFSQECFFPNVLAFIPDAELPRIPVSRANYAGSDALATRTAAKITLQRVIDVARRRTRGLLLTSDLCIFGKLLRVFHRTP